MYMSNYRASEPCAHVPPAPLVRMREYISTFRKIFFSKLYHLPRSGPCAHAPGAASAHARVFFEFLEIFFFENFFSRASEPCAHDPPAPLVRLRETLRIGEFGSLLLSMMLILFKTLYFVMLIA